MFPLVCLCTLLNLTYIFTLGYFWFLSNVFKFNLHFHTGLFLVFPTLPNLTYIFTLGYLCFITFSQIQPMLMSYVVFVLSHLIKFNLCLCPRLSLSFHYFDVLTYVFALGYSLFINSRF